MGHSLLLLAVFCSCILAIAGEGANTCIRLQNLPSRRVVLECRNKSIAFDLVSRAVWTRDSDAFISISSSFDTSRMTINDNGTITVDPALPGDEGEYRCGGNYQSLGKRFNFTVSPYAPKRFHQAFGHLGSNFTIPCHVKIGTISRQQGFIVKWIRRIERPIGQPLDLLIDYNSEQDTAQLIPSSHDPSHVFNSTDLSLRVHNFSVPNVNRKEIYYTCEVITGPTSQQRASATTNVTTQFTPIKIITPLPSLIIGHPGELIVESFVYEGAPVLNRVLSLDGNNITKSKSSRKFNFQRESQSDNTTKISLEILDPLENDTGLLKVVVEGVNSTASTESHLIIIPQIKNLQLTSGQGGDRLCGDLTLSFELAKPIPSLRVNLQVKVRFGEVPSLRMAGSRGRTVNETYSIDDVTTLDGSSNAEGYSTVKVNLSSRLPDLVAEFDRYRLEALLDVNGMEGRLFSPLTASILRDCTPLEKATLSLAIQFEGDFRCSEMSNERNVLSQAILSAVRDHCNANCDDLTFGTPQLTCSVDNTRGNFTTEVTAFEAQAVVTDFYRATQDPVLIEKDDVTFMIQCSTCTDPPEPTEDESNFMRYIIIGLVGVIAALILLVLVLILAVVKKKKKSPTFCSCYGKSQDPEQPQIVELQSVAPTIQIAPEPPPRSPISLTLPPNIRSRAEQTHANPTPNGKRMHSTALPVQNGDPALHVPAPPLHAAHPGSVNSSCLPPLQLREAATLARAHLEVEYCPSPSTYQGSDTSSAYYIRPDNQSPCSLNLHSSPRTTPPASPSRATMVSAQDVAPPKCVCQFRHSPTPPRAYKYCYTPPAKPVASSQSPHHCISLSNLALPHQSVFRFPPDVVPCNHCSCVCMRTPVVHSCTCQRCRSNPELHAQNPKGEYITVGQLREHAAVPTSQYAEESGNPSHRQGVSVHQSPAHPSSASLPRDRRGYVLKTADFTHLGERHATPSTSQLKPDSTGYIPHTMLPFPSKIPSNSDTQCTAAPPATHPQERPVPEGYVMCPLQTTPSSISQPSYRPVRPGYVEHVIEQPLSICIPENTVYGPSSPVERTHVRTVISAGTHLEHPQRNAASSVLERVELPQDVSDGEAFRTTLWLNHDTMAGSEQAEESRGTEESTDNVGHVESARTDN